MATISSDTIVSYSNLKQYILDKIKNNCCNIDRLAALPDDINPNTERHIGVGSGGVKQTVIVKFIDKGNVIKQVSSTDVKQQFEEFLTLRGLNNKPNIPISSKAMLNLFNNITIFLSCRTKIYRSSKNGNTYIFYDDASNITYDEAPFEFNTDSLKITDSPGNISREEARKSVQSLITQINKTNKITAAELSIRCVCSSSSSCSSSSCSSSCCSSSSSSFIVYMLI